PRTREPRSALFAHDLRELFLALGAVEGRVEDVHAVLARDPAAGQVRSDKQFAAVVSDRALSIEWTTRNPGADCEFLGEELVDRLHDGRRLRHRRVQLRKDRGQGLETIEEFLCHGGFHSGPGGPSRAGSAVHPGPSWRCRDAPPNRLGMLMPRCERSRPLPAKLELTRSTARARILGEDE